MCMASGPAARICSVMRSDAADATLPTSSPCLSISLKGSAGPCRRSRLLMTATTSRGSMREAPAVHAVAPVAVLMMRPLHLNCSHTRPSWTRMTEARQGSFSPTNTSLSAVWTRVRPADLDPAGRTLMPMRVRRTHSNSPRWRQSSNAPTSSDVQQHSRPTEPPGEVLTPMTGTRPGLCSDAMRKVPSPPAEMHRSLPTRLECDSGAQ
mmetsp:Transcript_83819/g.224174  ORF Transcript_83819/g.224174 Transcript_83819/m.224174 type:complete len:208 (-) Transcript_83819:627-1250(-)